jgi:hypothetical protein
MPGAEEAAQAAPVVTTVYDLVTLVVATQSYCALVRAVAQDLDAGQGAFLARAVVVVERSCGVLGVDPAALRAEFGGGE